jgi:hypothetical protein
MRWETEWLNNSGSLSEATYAEIESQGHSREEVACYLEGARRGDGDNEHCQRLHPSGTTHNDPIEADAMRWETEWLNNSGSLSEATYAEIESQGHSREEVSCYLEGARRGDGDHRDGGGRHGDGDNEHCQRLHPSGTTHNDPIEADAMRWETEWLNNSGSLSKATYAEIESQGHSREEVACYLEGARRGNGDHRDGGGRRHRGR